MAKGKGKGKEYEDQDPISCARSVTITCCFFPTVLIVLGLIFFLSYNSRNISIELYNKDIDKWNSARTLFDGLKFSYNMSMFQIDRLMNGENWPLRDTCTTTGSSKNECHSTQALSYFLIESFDFYKPTIISYDSTILYTNTYESVLTEIYSNQDIECNISLEEDCIQKCMSRSGLWDMNTHQCTVKLYLNSICLRVNQYNNTISIDTTTDRFNNIGCYYKNQYKPAIYSVNQTDILIELRHSYDPMIIADSLTNGCSTSSISNNQCLDHAISVTNESASILLIIGGVLFIIYLLCVILCVFVCKSKLSDQSTTAIAVYPKSNVDKNYKQKLLSDPINNIIDHDIQVTV